MTNQVKDFLNSLKNISSIWPSNPSAAVPTHHKLNGALACIERREMSWIIQQETGSPSFAGPGMPGGTGGCGQWALGLSSTGPEQHRGRGVLGSGKGPPGLAQSNNTGEQFRPRLRACLCFPGSHTTCYRKKDHREVTADGFLASFGKGGAEMRLQRMWYFLYLKWLLDS